MKVINDFLAEKGLAFDVGLSEVSPVNILTGKAESVGFYTYHGETFSPLSQAIFSGNYVPVSYPEMLNDSGLGQALLDAGYKPVQGNVLEGGSKCLLVFQQDGYVIGNDTRNTHYPQITLSLSHNGKNAIAPKGGNHRPYCGNGNGWFSVTGSETVILSRRRTKNVMSRISDWAQQIAQLTALELGIIRPTLGKFYQAQVDGTLQSEFIAAMLPKDAESTSRAIDNRRADLLDAVNKSHSESNTAYVSAYDLFNGGTRFISHAGDYRKTERTQAEQAEFTYDNGLASEAFNWLVSNLDRMKVNRPMFDLSAIITR